MPYIKTSAHLNNCAFHAITPEIVAEIKKFAQNDRYDNHHRDAYKWLKACFESVYSISPNTLSWKDFAKILKNLKPFDKQIIMGPVLRRFMYLNMSLPASREALESHAVAENHNMKDYLRSYLEMQETGRYRSVEAELLAEYVCKQLGMQVTFAQESASALNYSTTNPVAEIIIYHAGSIQGVDAHYSRMPDEPAETELTNLSDLSDILDYFTHGTRERSLQGIFCLNKYVVTLRANIQRLSITLQAARTEALQLDNLDMQTTLQQEILQERAKRRPAATRPPQSAPKPAPAPDAVAARPPQSAPKPAPTPDAVAARPPQSAPKPAPTPGAVAARPPQSAPKPVPAPDAIAEQPAKPAIAAPQKAGTPHTENAAPQTETPHPEKPGVPPTTEATATKTASKPHIKKIKAAPSAPLAQKKILPAPAKKGPTLPPSIPEERPPLAANDITPRTPQAPNAHQPMPVLETEYNDYSFLLKCGAAITAMASVLAVIVVVLAITSVLAVSTTGIGVLVGASVLGGLLSFGLYHTSQKNNNQAALDAVDFLNIPALI